MKVQDYVFSCDNDPGNSVWNRFSRLNKEGRTPVGGCFDITDPIKGLATLYENLAMWQGLRQVSAKQVHELIDMRLTIFTKFSIHSSNNLRVVLNKTKNEIKEFVFFQRRGDKNLAQVGSLKWNGSTFQ